MTPPTPHTSAQRLLQQLLTQPQHSKNALSGLTPDGLACLFADASFLISVLPAIEDLRNSTGDDAQIASLLNEAFSAELAPIAYLQPILTDVSRASKKRLMSASAQVIKSVRNAAAGIKSKRAFELFAETAMEQINRFVLLEASHPERIVSYSLYRAFDEMDALLGIDYAAEATMRTNLSSQERLYEGAGVGVQTSYMSLLLALKDCGAQTGASFIDLGSGYGRAGLVVGLLRPDMNFTGYEFVPHRVAASRIAAERAGVSERVRYFAQDLADSEFEIPFADIYFMFDPFTQETYRHVFAQIKNMGRTRAVTVVAKGHASTWFSEAIKGEPWSNRAACDEGTIGIYRSFNLSIWNNAHIRAR